MHADKCAFRALQDAQGSETLFRLLYSGELFVAYAEKDSLCGQNSIATDTKTRQKVVCGLFKLKSE